MPYLEAHRLHNTIHYRLHPNLPALLGREPKRADQWHPSATGRIRTRDRARPEPGNHRRLAASVLLGQIHLWVEMPDTLPSLVPHPITIVADIFCQSLGTFPLLVQVLLSRFGVHWR